MIQRLEQIIVNLETSIKEMEEDQGWNLSQDLYNRDWKKDVRQAKARCAAYKKDLKKLKAGI